MDQTTPPTQPHGSAPPPAASAAPPPAGAPASQAGATPPQVQRSFLVQRFARLSLGQYSIIGYSVAGEETVCQVPELNVCFDIGRCPYFALTSDIVCISHGHMDHVAGLGYYLSQRYFQGMKGGTILVPREIEAPVDRLLRAWRDVERQGTPYTLVGMGHNEIHQVRRDFAIRALATHHGGSSLGYALISVREKLKSEYVGTPGHELGAMRNRGVEIQYRLEVPLVTYLGDTTAGPVYEHPDVINAETLITECTFFDPAHKTKAKAGKHLHMDALVEILPRLKNQHVIIAHVTRRSGIRAARAALRRRIGPEVMAKVHFLMDFEGASEAGEIEDAGPPPADTAE